MSGEPSPSGLPPARLETLGDGVFAIAMTVLVLGIAVPNVPNGKLWHELVHLWPKFASYALSFVMLGVLWIGHYYQFQYIKRVDRTLIWINLLFLLTVTFLPFCAGVLGNSYEDRVAVIIYGGSIIASGALLVAHWRYATSNGLCAPDLAPQVVSVLGGRIAIGMVVSALAIAVGFIDTRISLAVFCLLPVPYMRRSALERAAAQRQ
ncbi:MAG TPA: TMEM175 family protein [Kofleriaceae bacterium]|nr:TMEM175 family protein [Kofleriaceae bacterium]